MNKRAVSFHAFLFYAMAYAVMCSWPFTVPLPDRLWELGGHLLSRPHGQCGTALGLREIVAGANPAFFKNNEVNTMMIDIKQMPEIESAINAIVNNQGIAEVKAEDWHGEHKVTVVEQTRSLKAVYPDEKRR